MVFLDWPTTSSELKAGISAIPEAENAWAPTDGFEAPQQVKFEIPVQTIFLMVCQSLKAWNRVSRTEEGCF